MYLYLFKLNVKYLKMNNDHMLKFKSKLKFKYVNIN